MTPMASIMNSKFFKNVLSRLAMGGLVLALLAALAAAVAGPGYRVELWPLGAGFAILTTAAYVALAAAGICLLGILLAIFKKNHRRVVQAAIGLVIGVIVVYMPWNMRETARLLPLIHDVSTDTIDPPVFIAVLPLRANALNSADYGGPDIAEKQRAGYPDIAPQLLEVPPSEAFSCAESAARDMGWEIVALAPEDGRVEATATTPWWGFKDDVVIRIRARQGGSLVDVRSVSRVGMSDLGANAARIRKFQARLGN